jgi:hypothetical protein
LKAGAVSLIDYDAGPQMAGSMLLMFCVAWTALLALASTVYRIELARKRIDMRLRELKELRAWRRLVESLTVLRESSRGETDPRRDRECRPLHTSRSRRGWATGVRKR